MAIDITGLTSLSQRAPEIIGKLVNKETVLGRFTGHEGYNPGPAILRLYEGGGDLGECCTIPETTGSFSEVHADVACIMSGNEFCEQDLARYLNDFNFRFTAGGESIDGPLEQVIMENELAKVAVNIDKLVFQGNTASADDNLNRLDGLVKLASANAPAQNQFQINTGNVYSAMQQIIASVPFEAYDMGDVAILVGRDVAQSLQAALIGLNYFHFNPGNVGSDDDLVMPGFSRIKIVPNRGLDGTGIAIASPLENIHWLTSLSADHMNLDWDYTKYRQLYYWRVKFLLGITFAVYDYVVMANIAPDVIKTMPSLPVSIVSPIGVTGGVKTE